ncbi:hypothetical protein IAI44_29395 [Bacillus cereus]|uniref:hypothetical protein n=1 Tax=Bacillus cereus TaxID=1396 RepID=UPI000BF8A1A1|nr:hypothetical protein [Bacillus cereus]AZJ24821.1 hypothetical protein CT694_35990 [Bacillus wiedmannii bv. thuringiensis]PFU22052.1 hypothetical protein COK76_24325 [Bacillus cereus]
MKLANSFLRVINYTVFTLYVLFCLYICYGTSLNILDLFNAILNSKMGEMNGIMLPLVASVLSMFGVVIVSSGAVKLYYKLISRKKEKESVEC